MKPQTKIALTGILPTPDKICTEKDYKICNVMVLFYVQGKTGIDLTKNSN